MRPIVLLASLTAVSLAVISPNRALGQDSSAAHFEPTSCNFQSSPYAYFPSGALSPKRDDLDAFEQCWYGGQLKAMGEPVLHTLVLPPNGEVYRFTWLRTFHHPIAVRLERRGDSVRLFAIELDGAGGYAPGKPVRRIDREVSTTEWADLRKAFERAVFWDLPPTTERFGNDGAQWILEGRRTDQYHLAVRWTPDVDGPDAAFRELCLHILSLADLAQQNEVY
jgi:hypothetical protein